MFLEFREDIYSSQHATVGKLDTLNTTEVLHQTTLTEAKWSSQITFNSSIFLRSIVKIF